MSDGVPWHTTLEPELQTFVTTQGLDKLDAATALSRAIKGHHEASKLIASTPRLPLDAADPNFQAAYDRLRSLAPAPAPDAYKFDDVKFKDSSGLDAEDVTWLREMAIKHKWTPAEARDIAASYVQRADATEDGLLSAANIAKTANKTALEAHWGPARHGELMAAAVKAAENLKISNKALEAIAAAEPAEYVAFMERMAQLAPQLGEAAMLGGGGAGRMGDPFAGMTPEQADAEWTRLTSDPAYRQKWVAGDAQVMETWRRLGQIVSKAAAQPRPAMAR